MREGGVAGWVGPAVGEQPPKRQLAVRRVMQRQLLAQGNRAEQGRRPDVLWMALEIGLGEHGPVGQGRQVHLVVAQGLAHGVQVPHCRVSTVLREIDMGLEGAATGDDVGR